MSNDLVVINTLPAQIVALNHATLDEAMALCERAHGIVIPAATIDEAGCRSALAEANAQYRKVEGLEKDLEQARLARGREITAVKEQVDRIVKAATGPLADQRARLGMKIMQADRDLKGVIARKQQEAEAAKRRQEEEARRIAEEAQRAREAADRAAAEAKRQAEEAAARADAFNIDLPPDDPAILAAKAAEQAAAAAAQEAAAKREQAFDATFAPPRAAYVAPAPTSAVKSKITYSIVVEDLQQVPREVGGVSLFVLDEAVAKRMAVLLDAQGKSIPGIRLVKTEGTSSKGRGNAFSVG